MNGGNADLGKVIFCVDSGASGTLNLNGGIFSATAITNGNNGDGFLNFNGGTLQAAANNPDFISGLTSVEINSGGAVIDSQGYNIAISQELEGSGGLTKTGSGTLILTRNYYTGTTFISSGTLAANTFAGPVTVASGGTLSCPLGAIGTVTITNVLALLPGSTTFMQLTPNDNDQFEGLTGASYGGSLIVSNISAGAFYVGQEFKLFNCASAGNGNFSSVTILPSGSGTFNPLTGILTITGTTPTFKMPVVSPRSIILTGNGGVPSANYTLLMSTNIMLPLAEWTTNTSGTFDGLGRFSNSIPIPPSEPTLFFYLRVP
jgi:autotransporter-associated beta strand protein